MKTKLTPAKIKRLRPQSKEFTVWDSTTPHFGIKVTPTGSMRFIHIAPQGGKLKKTTIGDVQVMPLEKARGIANDINSGEGDKDEPESCPTFGEWVDVWWSQTGSRLKPSTRESYQFALNGRLMPAFRDRPLNEIDRLTILHWFERSSRKSPGAANYALGVLRGILNHAVSADIIKRSPLNRISPNPRRKMTRFLSEEERARLLKAIDEVPHPHRFKALAVKLLIFTGCRRNEILSLRWSDVGETVLNLADSKAGPRKVWLCAEARATLDELRFQHKAWGLKVEFVFPNLRNHSRWLREIGIFWRRLRKQVGIRDVRLHDLRHSFATQAVSQGIPLPVVSKLLGHTNINMTMRYTHSSNAEVEAASERIGQHLYAMLHGEV